MKIYIFIEYYPTQYKPYFDTQFEQFIKDGHTILIFARGQIGFDIHEKVIRLNLKKFIRYTPSTLSSLTKFTIKILLRFLRNPIKRSKCIFKIADKQLSLRENILKISRMLIMPLDKPDMCLIHNLWTATRFDFLKQIYDKVPVAFYYHGGELPDSPVISPKNAYSAFNAVDLVITNTKSSKDQVIERGCDPNKVKILPVGFNMEEFPDYEKQYRRNGKFHLISVGRFSEEKGFIYSLEAIKLLLETGIDNFKYVLVGGGPQEKELRQFVKEHGLTKYVDFHGFMSPETLVTYFKNCDALVLPSIKLGTNQETQACVAQEAMLMKTLVVAANTGGIPESIAPELKNYLTTQKNPVDISKKLQKLMGLSDSELSNLGETCRQFVVKKYDIKQLNRKLIEKTLDTI